MNRKLAPFYKARNNINFEHTNSFRPSYRIYLVPVGFAIASLFLFGRLFHLTIVKGAYYQDASENNRIRELVIEGKRGTIYDRHNKELVYSEEISSSKSHEAATFERHYMFGSALGHVVGYRQKASEKDFDDDACLNKLILNDKIGRAGIEDAYECHLRPKKGKKLIEVNAGEKYVKTISEINPKSGKSIKLSIDGTLQQYIYNRIMALAILKAKPLPYRLIVR